MPALRPLHSDLFLQPLAFGLWPLPLSPPRFPAHTRRMGTLYYGDNLEILKRYL